MSREPDVRYELFHRPNSAGKRLLSVRFIGAGGEVLATRATGCEDLKGASGVVARLLGELDFAEIAASRSAKRAKEAGIDAELKDKPVAEFIRWYWSAEGHYVKDRLETGQPLASDYLRQNRQYIEHYIGAWEGFRDTPLRKASFALFDRFFREARRLPRVRKPEEMVTAPMLKNMRDCLRSPINWASARGYCPEIDFTGILIPAPQNKKRGLLTDDEVGKILALPTQELWRTTLGVYRADVKPRPKLKGFKAGEKNPEADRIDIRMKASVLIGPFCGFRRGEERGLRWGSVHFEEGFLRVENNYVRGDGDKRPKADSFGDIPLAPELEVVLWELKELAHALHLDSPEDYVLFNPTDPSKPAAESTLRRGWERVMRLIGISDAERVSRNLVPHGTRHRFATKLVDAGIDPRTAQRLTRHKTLAMFERYSNHISAETMERAREAIRGRKK